MLPESAGVSEDGRTRIGRDGRRRKLKAAEGVGRRRKLTPAPTRNSHTWICTAAVGVVLGGAACRKEGGCFPGSTGGSIAWGCAGCGCGGGVVDGGR